MPEATQGAGVHRFGAFEINVASGELRKNGTRLKLSGQPFQVLALLIERAGEIVTREELHSKLWQADTFVDFDHGLNNAVARIRDVLNDSSENPRYLETVPRRGYRFIAPLSGAQPATISPPPTEAAEQPGKSRFTRTYARILLAGAAVIAVFVAGFVLYRNRLSSTKQLAIKSLAVLPMKNLSGDPAQEYLADGMTEELIGRLAGLHDIRVISRTSIMRFKDTKLSAPEIANTLRVDDLVEGSVIRQGNRIRVHAQLIRAATEQHFWSETYDREMGNILALESEVAQSITEKVAVTVTGQERSRLIAARHVSPEVYESYLKGKVGIHDNRAELEESVTYFEDAIKKDPTFAPAYVGLASAYKDLAAIFVGGPPAELRPRVISTARKALELDPELADAHVLIADMYLRLWQWSAAEIEYKRALYLNPNDANAHRGFADWLLCHGRIEEALAWARRGRELDPLGDVAEDIGWILFQARRYSEAIRELRSYLAVHPNAAFARWHLGFALIGEGQPGRAIPELERTAFLMHRSPGALELLATAYGYAGRHVEALELINELKQRRQSSYVPAGVFINPYLALREYDQAFACFEQAYKEKSSILIFLKVHPFFDPIRGDPRFQDLVRRVGLQ